MQSILTGGNHLANFLLGRQCYPEKQHSYQQVLEDFGEDVADVWVAWRAIMDHRESLRELEE